MKGKSEIKCHTRWLELINCSHFAKGTWTREEDEILTKIVVQQGAKNWTHVAKSLPGRIGKQCRERWHNHLDPNITKRKWTMQEDILIVTLHLVHGNRWCDIAKQVKGRTDNAIKNRFNSNLSKRLEEPQFAKLLSQSNVKQEENAEDTSSAEMKDSSETKEVTDAKSEPVEEKLQLIKMESSPTGSTEIKIKGSILKKNLKLNRTLTTVPSAGSISSMLTLG